MNLFKNLIEKNSDIDFVVHVRTKEELDALITALEELGFEYAIPVGSLQELAEQFVANDGYDGCWRISASRGIAYNDSVEHWKQFINDIVEIQDGKIQFHEGYVTLEDAQIEEKKLWKAFTDAEYSALNRRLFGLENASEAEIQCWIKERLLLP